MPLFNKVAQCVTAWPNVTCLDNITTYWTMVLPTLSDIDCSAIWHGHIPCAKLPPLTLYYMWYGTHALG